MHSELCDFIDSIKAERDRIQGFDEATTKQFIIQRIFHLLGWNIFTDLIPEYQVQDGRVDFAIQRDGASFVFVEAKRVGADLDEAQEQLLRYAFQEGVGLGVLTNGVSWWLYLPLAAGSWAQRRFFAIDLLEQPSTVAADSFMRFLSSARVVNGEAARSAEEYRQSRQRQAILEKTMPIAWNRLMSGPDELLLDLLIETAEAISGYRAEQEMAAKFVAQYSRQFRVPEPQDMMELPIARSVAPQAEQAVRVNPADFTGTKPVSFTLADASYSVDSWKALLFQICDLLYQQDPDLFVEASLSLRGRKRPYFSINPDELRSPLEFRNTGVYVETNQSASSIFSRCRSLIALFDHDPDDLLIVLDYG